MIYPGYLLNPGDLFQVDPERVMFATGTPKDSKQRRAGRLRRRIGAAKKEAEEATEEETQKESAAEEPDHDESRSSESADPDEDPRETLRLLLSQAKSIMSAGRDTLPAKRKQDIRAFQRAVRRVLSRSTSSTILTDNLEAQFLELKALLSKEPRGKSSVPSQATSPPASVPESPASSDPTASAESSQSTSPPIASTTDSDAKPSSSPNNLSASPLTKALQKAMLDPDAPLDQSTISDLSDLDLDILKQALYQLRDNPIDSTKPYATPWRPREYMSAFAFIPRYLEVNQNICAAVYLRHPVARPGIAEVPTPFGEAVSGAAFGWYLRRR
jgi:hypothetical protein